MDVVGVNPNGQRERSIVLEMEFFTTTDTIMTHAGDKVVPGKAPGTPKLQKLA